MELDGVKAIATIIDAFQTLPDAKKEYLLGYAEGVAAMAAQKAADGKATASGTE